MAKQSGLGDNAYVGGSTVGQIACFDLSGDVAALTTIQGGNEPLEVAGINRSAQERIGGIRDGEISFNVWFNDATDQEHGVLSTLPTIDAHIMYCRGTSLGNQAAAMLAKQVNYGWSRGNDGSLRGSVRCLANARGLEWGRLLTAGKRTDTGATNGSSVDDSASSTFGLAAYMQYFTFVGTSAVVKLQESSDDGVVDPYADVTGGAFTAVTGGAVPGPERIQTSLTQTVERWLRCVTTGTFTSLVFAVTVVRHLTAVGY